MDPMSIAAAAAGPVVTGVMGLIDGDGDARQVEQQKKLTDIQLAADKSMLDYSLRRTNAGAQAQQYKAAGMNPALAMKGGAGAGQGATTSKGGEASSNTQREAIGLQRQVIGAQVAEMLTQAEKNKAEAKAAEANTGKTTAEKDVAIQSLSKIAAEVNESVARRELLGVEADVMRGRYEIAMEDVQRLKRENSIGEETYNSAVMAIRWEAAGKELDNEIKRAGVEVSEAQRNSIQQAVLQRWQEVATAWKNADIAEKRNIIEEANTAVKKYQADTDRMKTVGDIEYKAPWAVIGRWMNGKTVEEVDKMMGDPSKVKDINRKLFGLD